MDGDGDKDAGILFIKASERLATPLGMNAPIGHAVQMLLGRRDIDGDESPDILAEINELRAARGRGP